MRRLNHAISTGVHDVFIEMPEHGVQSISLPHSLSAGGMCPKQVRHYNKNQLSGLGPEFYRTKAV